MLKTIACVISFICASDPLFEAMQGKWKGQGFTVQVISGRKSKLSIETESVIGEDRMVSRSTVVETPVDTHGTPIGESHTYQRVYWIKAAAAANHSYDFGVGEGEQEVVTSRGTLENDILSVQESFGGEPPYWLDSRTRLNDDETFTQQTLWHGSSRLSETQIFFRRELM